MSKTNAPYHVVFATKGREKTIPSEHKRVLYSYIHAILKESECLTYRINGMGDHVHILFNLNPKLALAPLVQKVKQSTSKWMSGDGRFPRFAGWAAGYYGFVVGSEQLSAAIEYVKNQEIHHQSADLRDEVMGLATKNGLIWYEGDWA